MKSAQRQFLVKVTGIAGFFANKSGGEVTADASRVYDGGSLNPEVMTSPAQTGDITVSRPFDRARDYPVQRQLQSKVGTWRTTVHVTPTDEMLVATDEPTVYTAVLTGVTPPETDAASGDPAVLELTFAVEGVA